MDTTKQEKPRGVCTGCKFEYQLSTARKGEFKGMLVVRKHLSRKGPGECDGSQKPPKGTHATPANADAWQSPGQVAEPAPEGEQRDGVPPVFYASYDSEGDCGHIITKGDLIQSDGFGGYVCSDCIVEPEHDDNPPTTQPLPHDRGAHPETVTHIPGGHDFTDSTGATWRHGGAFDECTTVECVQFRNRLNPPVIERLGTPEHACEQGVFMLLRNCPVHGVRTEVTPISPGGLSTEVVAVAPGGVPVPAPGGEIIVGENSPGVVTLTTQDTWSAPGPASAAELPSVHGQPEPKRDRWGRYVFNGTSHTRATTFAKSASSTHALSEWRERMVVLGLTMRRDLLAMAHGKHVKRDRTELNSIATQAKDAAGVKVAANLGTAYHAFSERLDAGLMTLDEVPEEYRPRLAEYQQAIAAHGLVTRPEWIERSTAVRADQVAAELPVGGTLDRIFQLPNGELVIGDLKTGSDLSYGWGEIAVQLALYAHGVNTHGLFDWNTDTWENFQSDYDQKINIDYGIVIHLPADGSGCTLYRIDLKAGWRRAQVCGQVMAMQKSKDKLATEMFPAPGQAPRTPVVGMLPDSAYRSYQDLVPESAGVAPVSVLPQRSPHLIKGLEIVAGTAQIEALGALLGHARESGVFTDAELAELKAACATRWQELQGT